MKTSLPSKDQNMLWISKESHLFKNGFVHQKCALFVKPNDKYHIGPQCLYFYEQISHIIGYEIINLKEG